MHSRFHHWNCSRVPLLRSWWIRACSEPIMGCLLGHIRSGCLILLHLILLLRPNAVGRCRPIMVLGTFMWSISGVGPHHGHHPYIPRILTLWVLLIACKASQCNMQCNECMEWIYWYSKVIWIWLELSTQVYIVWDLISIWIVCFLFCPKHYTSPKSPFGATTGTVHRISTMTLCLYASPPMYNFDGVALEYFAIDSGWSGSE